MRSGFLSEAGVLLEPLLGVWKGCPGRVRPLKAVSHESVIYPLHAKFPVGNEVQHLHMGRRIVLNPVWLHHCTCMQAQPSVGMNLSQDHSTYPSPAHTINARILTK